MADEAPDRKPSEGSNFPHLNITVVNPGSSTGSSGSSSGTSTASLSSAGLHPLVSSLPVQLDAGRVVSAYSYLPPQTVHLQGVAGNTQQQQIPSSVTPYPSIHGWGTTSHLPVPCYGPVAYPYRNVAATSPMEQLYGHPNLQPVPSLQLVHMQPPGQRPIQPTTVQDGRGVCYYNHAVLTPIPMRQASPIVQTAVPVPSAPTNKVVLLFKKVEPQRSETIRANVSHRQEQRPVVVYHIPETPADPEECQTNLIDRTVLPRALETTPSSLDGLRSENVNVLGSQPGTQEAHQPPPLPAQDQEPAKRDSSLVDFMDEFQLPQDLLNTDQFPDIEKLIASIEPLLPECLFPPIDPKEASQDSSLQEMSLEGAKANTEVKNIRSETQEKSILEMQTIKEACVHPARTSILPVTRKSVSENVVPVIDLCGSEDEVLKIHKSNTSDAGQKLDEPKSNLNPAISIDNGSFPQKQKTMMLPMPFLPRTQHLEGEGISISGQGAYEHGGAAAFENATTSGTIYTISDGVRPTPKELIAPKDTTKTKYLKKTKKANSHTLESGESHSSTKVISDLQLPKDKRKNILTKADPSQKISGKPPALDKSRSKGTTTGSEKVQGAPQSKQLSGSKNKKHVPQQREEASKGISTKHAKLAPDTGLKQSQTDACSEQHEAKRSHEEETKKPTQELLVKGISAKHEKLAADTGLKRIQSDARSGQQVAKRSHVEETKKPNQELLVKGISTKLAADTTGLKRVQSDSCSEHVAKKSHVEDTKKPNQEPSAKGISTKHVKLAVDTTGLKRIQSDACSGQHVAKKSRVEERKKPNQESPVKGISTKHVKLAVDTTGLKHIQSDVCPGQHAVKKSHVEDTKKQNQEPLVKGISKKHVKLAANTNGLEQVQTVVCTEQPAVKKSHVEDIKKSNQEPLVKGISTKQVKLAADTTGLERLQSDVCTGQHAVKKSHVADTKKPNQEPLVKGISTKHVKLAADTTGLKRTQSDACPGQHVAKRPRVEEKKKPNQEPLVKGTSTKHVKLSTNTSGLKRVQSDACSEQHVAKRSHEEETKKPNQEPLVKGIVTKHVKLAADTMVLKRVQSDACSGQHVAKRTREEEKKPNQEPLVKGISTKHVKLPNDTRQIQKDACSEHAAKRSREQETKKPSQELMVKGISTKQVNPLSDFTALKQIQSEACSVSHVAKRLSEEETKKPLVKEKIKIFIPPSEPLDKKRKKNLGGEPNGSQSKDLQTNPNNSEVVKNVSKEQCKDKAKTNANPAGTKGKKKVAKIETETVKPIPRSNLALHMMESVQVFYPLGKNNLSGLPTKKIPSVTTTVTTSHTVPEKTPSMLPRPLPKSQTSTLSRQQPTSVSKSMPTSVAKPSSTSLPKAQSSSLPKPVTSLQSKPMLRQELKPSVSGPSGLQSTQVSQASSWRPSTAGSTYVRPKLPDHQVTSAWKPRDIRNQVLPNTSVSAPQLPKHFVSHTVRPSSPVQEFNGATFIPWRTPPDDLEESTPITEEQRPIREMMKKRAQREREEAACWTSVGRVKFFVEREKEMNTSIRFGYPWRR